MLHWLLVAPVGAPPTLAGPAPGHPLQAILAQRSRAGPGGTIRGPGSAAEVKNIRRGQP